MVTANAGLIIVDLPGGPTVQLTMRLPETEEGEGAVTFANHLGKSETVEIPAPVAYRLAAALVEVIPDVH